MGVAQLSVGRKGGVSMKSFVGIFVLGLILVLGVGTATATPIDLSTFVADPAGVNEFGGTVTFTEQPFLSAIFFYNDSFVVDPYASFLSFNYRFDESPGHDDYLVAVVGFTDYVFERGDTGSGLVQSDFSPYRGQTISLAFGLESNLGDPQDGDPWVGSSASIWNLDIATSTSPVPEPDAWLLVGMALVGLFGLRRQHRSVE
jgi:MYXO-CTERM domain-containing protein